MCAWTSHLDLPGLRNRELQPARSEGVTTRFVGHLIPLAFLAPEIVSAITTGSQPVGLTTERLTKETNVAMSWHSQRAQLGLE